MELKDLVILANAGFSKAEILGFAGQNQIQTQTPAQTPAQDPNNAVLDAINKLTATIQASNVSATGLQANTKQRTDADIINDLMRNMN